MPNYKRLFIPNTYLFLTITTNHRQPLYQPDFAFEILSMCRERGIHTAIESSLFCPEEVIRQISDKVDLFIADLKIFDPFVHRQHTGESNLLIKKNLTFLVSSGKKIIVRIPMVKNITDTEENINSILGYAGSLSKNIPVEFIEYNPLAGNNYRRLGIPFPLDNLNKES